MFNCISNKRGNTWKKQVPMCVDCKTKDLVQVSKYTSLFSWFWSYIVNHPFKKNIKLVNDKGLLLLANYRGSELTKFGSYIYMRASKYSYSIVFTLCFPHENTCSGMKC